MLDKQPTLQTRKKPVVVVSLITIAAAGLWIGFLLYRMNSPVHVTQDVSAQSLLDTPEAKTARLEKAKLMRAHWQKWAMKNKVVLREMLNPHSSGEAAFDRAWQSLPPTLTDDGSTGITYGDLESKGTDFTWNAVAKSNNKVASPSPTQNKIATDEKHYISKLNQEMYDKFHDIQIAQSINTGPDTVTLWASGRITQTTDQVIHEPRGTTLRKGDPQEIVPPYDTLGK